MFEMISLFKIYVYTEKAFKKMKNVCQKSVFFEAVYLDTFGLHLESNQIKNVLEFIQKTTETLSAYEKQFQGQLDIEMTHTEM